MAAKKETPATPPKTPPKTPAAKKELPRVIKVKHKKSGNEFEVTKDFYNRNKEVLEVI